MEAVTPSDRYTRTAILLHWLIAVAVIVQFGWGWWMQDIPKQPIGPRVDAFNLHKSLGLTILALMCIRLWWRWRHPPPTLPPMPRWQSSLAHANHVALYVALFVMPVAGYLGRCSAASRSSTSASRCPRGAGRIPHSRNS